MKKILTTILTILIIILSILLYSRFLGIKGLKTNEILLKENIPASFDNFKIVHFADKIFISFAVYSLNDGSSFSTLIMILS